MTGHADTYDGALQCVELDFNLRIDITTCIKVCHLTELVGPQAMQVYMLMSLFQALQEVFV